MPAVGTSLVAWLLTYLLHSTLLLALAALVAPRLARRSLALEESVWRAALFGALLTASLQVATGWRPLAGTWELQRPDAETTVATVAAPPRFELPAVAAEALEPPVVVAAPRVAPDPAPASLAALRAMDWTSILLGVWAAGALVLLARLGLSYLLLRRCLRGRAEVSGGTAFRLLARLAGLAPLGRDVRLTCAPRLPVPVAMGVRRPEIALPPRAYAELDEEPLAGLLAHELGHLTRRDPAWLLAGQLVGAVAFVQPLNRLALRRLREISELQCDEWAVGRAGSALSLAQCLTEVAHWSVGAGRRAELPAPGIAGRPSQLARRIRRLLDGERGADARPRAPWMMAALAAALLAVVVIAPGVSAGPIEPAGAEDEIEAAEVPATEVERAETAAAAEAAPAEAPVPAAEAEPVEPPAVAEAPEPAVEAEEAEPAEAPEAPIGAIRRQRPHRDSPVFVRPSRPDRERIEEIERTAEEIARRSADIAIRIEPQIRELEREVERISEQELLAITREVERVLERQAQVLGRDIVRLVIDAKRIAEAAKLTPKEKRDLEEAARRLAELTRPTEDEIEALRDAVEAHKEAIDALSAGALAGVREAMEEVRRELERERVLEREHRRRIERDLEREIEERELEEHEPTEPPR